MKNTPSDLRRRERRRQLLREVEASTPTVRLTDDRGLVQTLVVGPDGRERVVQRVSLSQAIRRVPTVRS